MTKLDLAHLSTRQTVVVQGAKAAKGQDAIEGTVMQFSSLMSVMNEDFALMNEMQRDYVPEKSEVPVPKEIREIDLPEDFEVSTQEEEIDFEVSEVINNFAEKEEPRKEIVVDEELVSLPEVFSDPTINMYSLEEVNLQAVVEPDAPEQIILRSPDTVIQAPVIQDAIVQIDPSEPVKIEVPDMEMAKFEIVDEVLQVVEKATDLLMEEVELEAEEPTQDDFGLKDLLKRDFLLEDDFGADEDVNLDEVTPEKVSLMEKELRPEKEKVEREPLFDENADLSIEELNALAINASLAAGISGTTTAVVQPTVVTASSDINISNIQDKRDKDDLPKMPKNLRHQSHFSELLQDADDKALEKMSFNNKLLRRLELIVNDPAGKLEVDIAQDPVGVHVKAIVPAEVLKSMEGLQQDLQVALYQKGLELGSFEMQERGEGVENRGTTNTIEDDDLEARREKIEETAIGGILVNQRV